MNLNHFTKDLYFPDLENSIANVLDSLILSDAAHKLLVVIDSLTFSVLEKVPSIMEYFDKWGHLLSSVYPTITSTALTSIYHGVLPYRHGIVGYKFRIPELEMTIESLTIRKYISEEREKSDSYVPLEYAGINVQMIAWTRTKFNGIALQLKHYNGRGISHILYGGAESYGFSNNIEAVSIAHRYLKKDGSFISLYFDDIDALSHIFSPQSDETTRGIKALWQELTWLLENLPPNTDAVILSDHGQKEIDHNKVVFIDSQEMQNFAKNHKCELVINGDIVFGYFPQNADLDSATTELQSLLGDDFIVAKTSQIGDKLYGKMNEMILKRCGEIVVLSTGGSAIIKSEKKEKLEWFKGNHGSLSKDELIVPVFRIRT